MFADDTAIITQNKVLELSIKDLRSSLDELSLYGSQETYRKSHQN